MPKCNRCPKRGICISSLSPSTFSGDCSQSPMVLSFTLSGRVCNIPVGTEITLQYTRECAPNTAVFVASTTVASDSTFTFNITNLSVPDPTLGNLNLFVQAVVGQEILAFAFARLKIKCAGPANPYVCCERKKKKCKC